ncbi:hypothetical protein OAI79_01845, partial [Gammaproteobacteria bacterium]|nr:hypothetical protein [Gammaproteobacteria bacterium]
MCAIYPIRLSAGVSRWSRFSHFRDYWFRTHCHGRLMRSPVALPGFDGYPAAGPLNGPSRRANAAEAVYWNLLAHRNDSYPPGGCSDSGCDWSLSS